ncbi:MAG: GNAT family N-acetyltransferase [bacterium]
MEGDIEIMAAGVADAVEILALQKLAYLSEAEIYNEYGIEPLTQTIEKAREDFAAQTVVKAVAGGRIIGSARGVMSGGVCKIGKLLVHPDYQNRGIGAALMREIERIFAGAKRFELFTGWKSEKNIYLYEKLGYRKYDLKDVSGNLKLVYMEKIVE